MWQFTLFVVSLYLTQSNGQIVQRQHEDKNVETVCSSVCNVCNDLITDISATRNVCKRSCSCLESIHKMMKENDSPRCKMVSNEVFCKLGRKVDDDGCLTDSCNTWLPCTNDNPLANCTHACPHGYKMDVFGCPTCDCHCWADKVGFNNFVHDCAIRCSNRYSPISIEAGPCPVCNCTGDKLADEDSEPCKVPVECPKNCGPWGVMRICNGGKPSCKCNCVITNLDCATFPCASGTASADIDEFGCATGCSCSVAADRTEIKLKVGQFDCPTSIMCPIECGPYSLKRVYDVRGCLVECRCECLDPQCLRRCPGNNMLKDAYGCPTCDCLPDWADCPIDCVNSCGPHNRLSQNDERGCPSTCDCNCPRSESHRDGPVTGLERPPLMCPVDCQTLEIKRDRFGCDLCQCKTRRCPAIRCMRFCGPHGFKKDRNNCDTCDCNCPKPSRCAPCPNNQYLPDGYGCMTCTCECPVLIDCDIDCKFGRVVNENGCEICKCAKLPRKPVSRKDTAISDCELEDCDKDCDFFQRFPNGCKKCRCCRPPNCRGLTCESGVLQVDENQCPICQCAKVNSRQLIKRVSENNNHCLPIKDCKLDCPMDFMKRNEKNCPVCECCEPTLKRDCPFLKCHKFQNNKDGCPICECDEKLELSTIADKNINNVMPCPELKCEKNCKQRRQNEHECPTCDCCIDFLKDCPHLKCDHYEVDHFGCAICRCQQMRLEMPKKSIHKCKYKEEELDEKCHHKCENLLYKVNENNCPICECCLPRLSHECPNLKCKVYQTDNHGCPICECVEDHKTNSRTKPNAVSCQDSENCKNPCKSGFHKSHGQCNTCECCPDHLSQCPDLKCNIYKSLDDGCPVCECDSSHSNIDPSKHSLVNTRCPPLKCQLDCSRVHNLLKLDDKNCHKCECCEPYLEKCPKLKCKKFKTFPGTGCPICECVE